MIHNRVSNIDTKAPGHVFECGTQASQKARTDPKNRLLLQVTQLHAGTGKKGAYIGPVELLFIPS